MRHFSNTNIEKLEIELKKCKLLCANCHREYHNPTLRFSNIPSLIQNCNKTSFSNHTEHGSVCPVCGKRFNKVTGKIYCSEECRWADKNYPSIEEVTSKYEELHSWEKVAQSFGLTRKIIRGIRQRNS
jgi:Zn finger protein HypA/HybF involved in hydrogenase expression